MFTDDAVTPVRLEVLVDLLRERREGHPRDEVYRLLQPESLKPDPKFTPAKATVRAGLELQLVQEKSGTLSLTEPCCKEKNSRSCILAAFDERVLRSTDVEKYFALFYSYYLGLGKQVYGMQDRSREEWANQFNRDVFQNVPQANRFNEPKHKGLDAWYDYIGLGWYDPSGAFQANPYERLARNLPTIFGQQTSLGADAFMAKLNSACLELDGGELFCQANPAWQRSDMKCTLGLSHALVELHLDKVIRLSCPADSSGWIVNEADPPGNADFKSTRFESIDLLLQL